MDLETPPNHQTTSTLEQEEQLAAEAGRSWRKENRRIAMLILAVGLFMLAAHFTPLRAWITNIQAWKQYVRDLGWPAHLGFGGACAAAVMVGVPRLPLCTAAGMLFGFAEGTLLSLAGSLLGSYGTFIVARKGGRRAVQKRADSLPWLKGVLARPSLMKVFWVRQLMLPGVVLNVVLGVTDVRHATFLAGTCLGYLPLNIAFSLVGGGMGKGSMAQTLVQMCAAAAIMNVIGWLVWKRAKNK